MLQTGDMEMEILPRTAMYWTLTRAVSLAHRGWREGEGGGRRGGVEPGRQEREIRLVTEAALRSQRDGIVRSFVHREKEEADAVEPTADGSSNERWMLVM